jgi:threonine dehydrogenase-like Zn-dependent dehydrogenase
MKVVKLCRSGDLRIDELETPTAGPPEAVIRIAASDICGADPGEPRPVASRPLGHEAAAVAAVGAAMRGLALDNACLNLSDPDSPRGDEAAGHRPSGKVFVEF